MNNKKGEVPKGFSGLGSLVSDIDTEMPPESVPAQPKPEPKPAPVREEESVSSVASSPAPNTSAQSRERKSRSSLWIFILVGISILYIWFGNSKKDVPLPPPPPPPAPAASQASSGVPDISTPYPPPAPTTTQSAVPSSNRSDLQIQESATFTGGAQEEIPPVGNGLTLYPKQIKWCLSEKIRISAWKDSVNEYSGPSVDAFNAGVSNYNSRCTHFRYRRGTLESIKQQVEANRINLQREGLERAMQNP